jgi:AraC-like DNA-binding protein
MSPSLHPSTDSTLMLADGLRWTELPRSLRRWSGEVKAYTITAVRDGASVWRLGGIEQRTCGGGLRLKRPGAFFRTVEVESPSAMVVLDVRPSLIERLSVGRVAALFSLTQVEHAATMERFLAVREAEDREAALVELLGALAQHAGEREALGRTGTRADVLRVRRMIESQLATTHSLQELATVAGVHPVTLVRLFRAEFGLPPRAFLLERRVEHAQTLLASGVSAADASARCGFFDQSHFQRHFKRVTGLTPKEFSRIELASRAR